MFAKLNMVFPCSAFLLIQEPHHEAAAAVDGTSADEENDSNIFPYLLVNIGSGVSMIEVCQYTASRYINHILHKSAVIQPHALKNHAFINR
jgi:hypothetical protein